MSKSLSKTLNKKQEREFKRFLEAAPFNFCDGFCDRCNFAGTCSISRQELAFQLKCQKEGKDPNDTNAFLEELSKNFKKIIFFLEEELKKQGIKPAEIEIKEEDFVKPEKELICREALRLNKLIFSLIREIETDLENTRPWYLISLQLEIIDLSYYGGFIYNKLIRALISKDFERKNKDNMEFVIPDSEISSCLALCALENSEICLKNILNLINEVDVKYKVKIDRILKLIEKIKLGINKRFPKAKYFKDKIIFHGAFISLNQQKRAKF